MEHADAYYCNDDEGDLDFPQDDVDLDEQFGSVETAQAFPSTEMENASSDMTSEARSFMNARKCVVHLKRARRFFPAVGVGAFGGLQSLNHMPQLVPRLPAKENAVLCQNLVVVGKVKVKPSRAKSRRTSSGPLRRGVSHRPRAQSSLGSVYCVSKKGVSREIVQIADHVTKMTQISNVLLAGLWACCTISRQH